MNTEGISTDSQLAFEAIDKNDIAFLKSILDRNVHPDALKDSYGNTLLYRIGTSLVTLEAEQLEMFKLLLSHGANPNLYSHRPLLHRLCTQKTIFADEMIKLAIAHGADIHLLNADKSSLLQSAAWGGKTWLVQMLINHGLDVNHKDEKGENALFYSINAFSGNVETIQLLLDNGAHKSELTQLHDGKLILRNLLIGNKMDVLRFLVSLGVDINAKDKNDISIIVQSAELGPSAMFKEILELGATVDGILHNILYRIQIRLCQKTLDRSSIEEAFKKLQMLHARNYPIAAIENVYNRHRYSDMLSDYVDSLKNRKNLKKYEEEIILGLLQMGFRHKSVKTFLEYLEKVKNIKVVKYLEEHNLIG